MSQGKPTDNTCPGGKYLLRIVKFLWTLKDVSPLSLRANTLAGFAYMSTLLSQEEGGIGKKKKEFTWTLKLPTFRLRVDALIGSVYMGKQLNNQCVL